MSDINYTLKPDELTFDPFGRVIVRNSAFTEALKQLSSDVLAESTSNSGGCGDRGCGNTGNTGGCGTANGACSSVAQLHYDDWTIFDGDVIVNNAEFSQGMLDVKMSGKLEVPMKLKIL